MALTYSLVLFSLVLHAFAAPQPALDARQVPGPSTTNAACVADPTSSRVAACVSSAGISSVCSGIASTVFEYSTITLPRLTTIRSTVSTSYTSTATRVSSRSVTITSTTTFTSTVRVTSGTTRSAIGTATSEVTSTSTQYTCPYSTSSSIFPTSTSSEDSRGLARRQATGAPNCLRTFRDTLGSEAIAQACKCLRPSQAIPTVTIVFTETLTSGASTFIQPRTVTTRSTTTTTTIITATSVVSSDIETTITVPATESFTTTVIATSIETITTAYPLPTGRFRLFITVDGQKLYGRNVQAGSDTPGTDVIALSPSASSTPSAFGFNNLMNLILSGTQTKIAVEQSTWDVPYVFLVPDGLPVPDPWTAPAFAPCNGSLIPGGAQSNYVFAACYAGNSADRRLAFGSPGTWSGRPDEDDDAAAAISNGTCIIGSVGIEAVSGTLTPTSTADVGAGSTQSSESPTVTSVSATSSTSAEESSSTSAEDTSSTSAEDTSSTSSSASSTGDFTILPIDTSTSTPTDLPETSPLPTLPQPTDFLTDLPSPSPFPEPTVTPPTELPEPLPQPTVTPPVSPPRARAPEAY